MSDRRRPGEVVVLREFHGDRIWAARPAIVLRDDGEDLSFFIPEGTRGVEAVDATGHEVRLPHVDWRLERAPRPGRRSIRSFASTREPHAVLAIWDAGWRPRCWYVNLQLPLRRSPVGFDTTDLVLDLVGTPDARSWRWKDEDELAEAVAVGTVDATDVERIRAEAVALADAVAAGRPPFDGDPWAWRPATDAELLRSIVPGSSPDLQTELPPEPPPELPEDWDRR